MSAGRGRIPDLSGCDFRGSGARCYAGCEQPRGGTVPGIGRWGGTLEITEVRLRLVDDAEGPRLRAFASVTFDQAFVVHDLKVIDGPSGLFVAMPSRRSGNGEFRDIAHPIDPGMRARLTEAVLAEYRRQLDQRACEPGGGGAPVGGSRAERR